MLSVGDATFKILGIGLLALSLAACGTGGGPPSPTGYKYYAYVANSLDDTVSAFSLDPDTGALTPAATITLKTNVQPHSLAVTPSGKFAYVVGSYYTSVYAYSIDAATGAWNGVPGTPFSPGVHPSGMTIDPSGRYLYVAGYADAAVAALRINSDTGRLTVVPGSPFPVAGGPFKIAVEPQGKFAYVLGADPATVTALAIDGTTGALTALGDPVAVGTEPESLTIDPVGRHLYVPSFDINSKVISAFAIDAATGALTAVAGSPFAVPQPPPFMLFPEEVAVEPSGRFAYVICLGSMTMTYFDIDAVTGALTPTASVVPIWNSPRAMVIGPTGRHIYVAYSTAPGNLTIHEIDPGSGAVFIDNVLTTGNYPSALVTVRIAQ